MGRVAAVGRRNRTSFLRLRNRNGNGPFGAHHTRPHENNIVATSIQAAALVCCRIAGNFLEPAFHHGSVQPAAPSLFEKNHFRFLGGERSGLGSAIERRATLFQFYAYPFFGAERDAGQ